MQLPVDLLVTRSCWSAIAPPGTAKVDGARNELITANWLIISRCSNMLDKMIAEYFLLYLALLASYSGSSEYVPLEGLVHTGSSVGQALEVSLTLTGF